MSDKHFQLLWFECGPKMSECISEQQVVFTKKMMPVTAEEHSEATLEVEVSLDSGEVQWMRQGVLIHPGAKCTLKHKGRKHSLTIHNLAVSDRGTYSCETLHDRTQTQLTVERESAHVLVCPVVACLLPLATTPPQDPHLYPRSAASLRRQSSIN